MNYLKYGENYDRPFWPNAANATICEPASPVTETPCSLASKLRGTRSRGEGHRRRSPIRGDRRGAGHRPCELLDARLDGHGGKVIVGGAGGRLAAETFAGDGKRPLGGADGGVVGGFGASDVLGLNAAADEVIEEALVALQLEKPVNNGVAIELFDNTRRLPIVTDLAGELLDTLGCLAGQQRDRDVAYADRYRFRGPGEHEGAFLF